MLRGVIAERARRLQVGVAVQRVIYRMVSQLWMGVRRIGHAGRSVFFGVEHRSGNRAVRGREADREHEGPVAWSVVEEALDAVAHDRRDDFRFGIVIDREVLELLGPEPRPVIVAAPEVELFQRLATERVLLQSDLADEADVIALLAQQGGVGLVPLRVGEHVRGRKADLMHALVLAVHEARTAGHANRGDHVGLGEAHAVIGQLVNVRGLKDRIASDAEGIRPLIVGKQKDDVGPGCGGLRALAARDRRENAAGRAEPGEGRWQDSLQCHGTHLSLGQPLGLAT